MIYSLACTSLLSLLLSPPLLPAYYPHYTTTHASFGLRWEDGMNEGDFLPCIWADICLLVAVCAPVVICNFIYITPPHTTFTFPFDLCLYSLFIEHNLPFLVHLPVTCACIVAFTHLPLLMTLQGTWPQLVAGEPVPVPDSVPLAPPPPHAAFCPIPSLPRPVLCTCPTLVYPTAPLCPLPPHPAYLPPDPMPPIALMPGLIITLL